MRYEMMAGILRSPTAIGFSWWPPLGGSESTSEEGATQSALEELTPLEWESEVPESEVDEVLTQPCSAWVGRWHSMASAISGPATNITGARSW